VRKLSETVYVVQHAKTHPIIIVIIPFNLPLPNKPARHSVMASSTVSPNYLVRRCNWGPECMSLKKLLDEAGDVLLTRMIRIHPGNSETCIALRSVVKFHFKLGTAYDDSDFFVAAHHWAPSLIKRNYEGSKGNRPSRQFKTLLTRAEAGSYDCTMEETINNFESCRIELGF
jgi:hypothetical protein